MKHILHFSIISLALGMMACSQEAEQKADHVHTVAGGAAAPDSSGARLRVPPEGNIPVAFVISKNAEVLDFTGPLEVFSAAWTDDWDPMFKPYFVADSMAPVMVTGNMRVLPDYTFENAPQPKIIVIPAMEEGSERMIAWIREASKGTDVTMSVCNGAFELARTGLLDGKSAAAHHGGYFRFAGMFPKVRLQRGARYVEEGNVASAGGISSGIDLALRVVERYAGRAHVQGIVDAMEYQGTGWLDARSNQAFAKLPSNDPAHPICPLCGMDADTTIRSTYQGEPYYFCAESEKEFFDAHPEVMMRFVAEDAAQ
jgi:putative intracellular protease/amidase/YHS domain-containing protein